MSQQELLTKVVETLNSLGIDYMVTGAVASSMQGAPRMTHDIDIVVGIKDADAAGLLQAFPPPGYYLSEASISEVIQTDGSFNLIEPETGFKVDFWLLTDEPFDRSRFSRKQARDFHGFELSVPAPEDTILMKLSAPLHKYGDAPRASMRHSRQGSRPSRTSVNTERERELHVWIERYR